MSPFVYGQRGQERSGGKIAERKIGFVVNLMKVNVFQTGAVSSFFILFFLNHYLLSKALLFRSFCLALRRHRRKTRRRLLRRV